MMHGVAEKIPCDPKVYPHWFVSSNLVVLLLHLYRCNAVVVL